ncbi:ATP synthase subunit b [bacterium HR13]|nr:ATP synthase subunit b [bacterium HR13]
MTEGGHHLTELLWKGFNVLLFLGIVYYFGRKPVSEAFNSFYKNLTEKLNASEEELRLSHEELLRAKESYEDAQRRYREQIALAQETAQYTKEEEIKKAEQMAERIREKAKEAVQIETKRAKEELLRFGMEKARQMATDMLKKAFEDPEVQKRYIEKSLKSVEER